jgi:hypothetical protein
MIIYCKIFVVALWYFYENAMVPMVDGWQLKYVDENAPFWLMIEYANHQNNNDCIGR